LLPLSEILAELFQQRPRTIGKLTRPEGKNLSEKLIPNIMSPHILLLVFNSQTRDYLSGLLTESEYCPVLMKDSEELLRSLKEKEFNLIFIDCFAVTNYGTRILSRIKVACQNCRIIILCNKDHLQDRAHRELIKEVMSIGVYACILEPYEDWEVLSLLSYSGKRGAR
jgi:DNA-binding NtrC family response regulator